MSFFGGNPFSTPVGQRIEQATDASLASENWALNMEICDIINETEDGPKDAIKAIRKRLQQNAGKNYTVVMYTLTVLETCVKNCGKRFHILACNKEFVQELVKLIGPKNDPPTAVQEKVLSLIQSWADAFRNQSDLSGVVQVYNDLKQKGIEFPMTDLDTMAPIHTPQRSVPDVETVPAPVVPAPNSHPQQMPVSTGPAVLAPEQLAKLQSELDIVQGNMSVLNEMLSELTPGKEHPSDLELLHDLHATCKAMQQRIVELIGKVANDEITAELLRINDELNNLFLRHSRFEKNREGSQNVKAASQQAAKDDGESLIDLSDDAAQKAVDGSLNSKLAGLSLGTGNATSQLNRISSVSAQQGSQKEEIEREDSEFDMFAQSRNVTYETSKKGSSSYKDNIEPDQVQGGLLGAVTQTRAQPDGDTIQDDMIGMHKESDFDEMAAWLEDRPTANPGGQEESLTSTEFERFLAERAAAAENLPTIPSAAATTGPVSSSRPHHRQLDKEETESSLFAL